LQLFIPEASQKNTKNELNKLLRDGMDATCQLQVLAAKGNLQDIEWSVSVLLNTHKTPTGMILIAKNTSKL